MKVTALIPLLALLLSVEAVAQNKTDIMGFSLGMTKVDVLAKTDPGVKEGDIKPENPTDRCYYDHGGVVAK
jgi:hypothetical protein